MYHERARTYTFRFGLVDCPPGVARPTLRGAVQRAIHTGLRHTVIAYASIHCEMTVFISTMMHGIVVRDQLCTICTRTNTCGSGVVDRPPGVTYQTIPGTVLWTTSTGVRHAVFACARIDYKISTHISASLHRLFANTCENVRAYQYTRFCRC